MKRIRNWILRMNIRQKLVFYSYLFITPVLLLISILLLIHNYYAAVQSEEDRCIQSVQSISNSISVVQKNIMEMGTYISINEEIKKILTASNPEKYNEDVKLWVHNAPMQIIQDMVAIDGLIKTIAIYPENGINPYLKCIDRSAYISDMEQIRNQEIYKLSVQEKGVFLWQRVGRHQSDTYQYNQGNKIVMYREIYDMARKHKLGYLVVGSSADIFDKICQDALGSRQEAIVVMSGYGTELVRTGTIADPVLTEMITENVLQTANGSSVQCRVWENYHIYYEQEKETGTVIYKIARRIGWRDISSAVLYAPLALLLGFLIGLYPVLRLVSDIVSKPLHTLCVAMEYFKQGDFCQKVEAKTMDEVGEASACFNSMVDDIKELIDKNYVMALKEKQSELDVLQAQINPHFLYNTLDALYWKATESGKDEIAEDILSLSQLFRLVLNRGNGIVTVQMETELLRQYLHIQKMRFGKRLDYEIVLDEEILDEEIPKLILQPFVENAIVHGFEKTNEEFMLSIAGTKEGHYMKFQIKDTGVGMSREQLDAIWDRGDNRKYASQRIGRYAIKNVKERLELVYHEDYSLKVESRVGKGTDVTILLPCSMEGDRRREH